MTAGTVAKAEQFLVLLDDLAGAKPNSGTAAVLLAHAATHLRGLLDLIDEHDRSIVAEAELDEVLDRVRENVREHVAENLAKPDVSHLPPMAKPGQDMCQAVSQPDAKGVWWECTARRGHVERWHAAHYADDGTGPAAHPIAAEFPDAAWPVVSRETGLPPWALITSQRECGATIDRSPGSDGVNTWMCNAEAAHEPLDHVVFAAMNSRMAGAVLARWGSVSPGAVTCPVVAVLGDEEIPCTYPQGHAGSHSYITPTTADLAAKANEVWQSIDLRNPPSNGHALRPPEWVCAACGNRFPGRKPEDGLCAKCGWPEDRLPEWVCSRCSKPCTGYRQDDGLCVDCFTGKTPDAIASLQEPAEDDAPFRLTAVPDSNGTEPS